MRSQRSERPRQSLRASVILPHSSDLRVVWALFHLLLSGMKTSPTRGLVIMTLAIILVSSCYVPCAVLCTPSFLSLYPMTGSNALQMRTFEDQRGLVPCLRSFSHFKWLSAPPSVRAQSPSCYHRTWNSQHRGWGEKL